MPAQYEVIAVRYGVMESTRSSSYYRYDVYGEPDGRALLDYFFWVVRDGDTTMLVDTGYHPGAITHRPGRVCITPPMDALARLGVAAESVSRVIVTHFHFDHTGNVASFPNARITVQRRELDFWLGPHGARPAMAASVEPGEIDFLRRACQDGRVDVLDGDAPVAPGISARLVCGHCPGQQIVVVDNDPPVVLASDALHFYEEMDRYMPYQVLSDVPGMYRTYDLLRELRDRSGAVIVAGHDPDVMTRFAGLDHQDPGLAVLLR
jgi:glyoxylase-like metal-dependent hydrolase (beta-lactamase superfamily II)